MIHEKLWRLNNLYRIVAKGGKSIPLHLNPIQTKVAQDPHLRKLILKARQVGLSTYAVIDLLDDVIFNDNFAGGIVSYSLEHAQHIYRRIIGHALETFLKDLRPFLGIKSQSAREYTLTNDSFLRVDTSLRGGSYQGVVISEYGKTCARSPQKAEEVLTGTIQAVAIGGKVTLESTGEGNDGYFADMVRDAVIRGEPQSPLDYKLMFFPWFDEKNYILTQEIEYDTDLTDYFNGLEKEVGIKISQQQRWWYAQQRNILHDKVRQEFPSTVSEAFLSSSDAYYYALYIEEAYKDNRCLPTSSLYDALLPVYVAMDIGVNDLTVMVFFQLAHGEIRVIDYYEDKNKGVDFYVKFLLQDKKYHYNTIYLPHDSKKRDGIVVENTYERDFRRLFIGVETKFQVLPSVDRNLSISHAKIKFNRCVFAIEKVKPLIEHLGKYRKKWHEPTCRYLDEPLHDVHSNYADAFRYMCQAVTKIEVVSGKEGALEKHRKAVEMGRCQI